jgi:hypothetical protein
MKITFNKLIHFNWQFNDDGYVFKDHLMMIFADRNMQWDIENKTEY